MTNYNHGVALEREYMQCLRARGAVAVMRSAGSHGDWDVFALFGDHAVLAQLKRGLLTKPGVQGWRIIARQDAERTTVKVDYQLVMRKRRGKFHVIHLLEPVQIREGKNDKVAEAAALAVLPRLRGANGRGQANAGVLRERDEQGNLYPLLERKVALASTSPLARRRQLERLVRL
jgi:hypothetical protein